jgi:hypothetical protein
VPLNRELFLIAKDRPCFGDEVRAHLGFVILLVWAAAQQ